MSIYRKLLNRPPALASEEKYNVKRTTICIELKSSAQFEKKIYEAMYTGHTYWICGYVEVYSSVSAFEKWSKSNPPGFVEIFQFDEPKIKRYVPVTDVHLMTVTTEDHWIEAIPKPK